MQRICGVNTHIVYVSAAGTVVERQGYICTYVDSIRPSAVGDVQNDRADKCAR